MPLKKVNNCIFCLNTIFMPDVEKEILEKDLIEIRDLLHKDRYNEAKVDFFAKECVDFIFEELHEAGKGDAEFHILPKVAECTEAILDLLDRVEIKRSTEGAVKDNS